MPDRRVIRCCCWWCSLCVPCCCRLRPGGSVRAGGRGTDRTKTPRRRRRRPRCAPRTCSVHRYDVRTYAACCEQRYIENAGTTAGAQTDRPLTLLTDVQSRRREAENSRRPASWHRPFVRPSVGGLALPCAALAERASERVTSGVARGAGPDT